MTTKFLTIRFAKILNFIVAEFPRKSSVFGQFSVKICTPQPPLSFQRLRVVSNLGVCNFYAEALFCALLCSFPLLRLRSFALICDLLLAWPPLQTLAVKKKENCRFWAVKNF